MDKDKNGKNNCVKEIIRVDIDDSESDSNGDSSTPQEGANGILESEKLSKAIKVLLQTGDMKFMNNFDPELSNREKRKLNRKFNQEGMGKRNASLYNENGILKGLGKDLCDCLNEDCPGCHFPCPKCRSCKCGSECRINRKWIYEIIVNESDQAVTRNMMQT